MHWRPAAAAGIDHRPHQAPVAVTLAEIWCSGRDPAKDISVGVQGHDVRRMLPTLIGINEERGRRRLRCNHGAAANKRAGPRSLGNEKIAPLNSRRQFTRTPA